MRAPPARPAGRSLTTSAAVHIHGSLRLHAHVSPRHVPCAVLGSGQTLPRAFAGANTHRGSRTMLHHWRKPRSRTEAATWGRWCTDVAPLGSSGRGTGDSPHHQLFHGVAVAPCAWSEPSAREAVTRRMVEAQSGDDAREPSADAVLPGMFRVDRLRACVRPPSSTPRRPEAALALTRELHVPPASQCGQATASKHFFDVLGGKLIPT